MAFKRDLNRCQTFSPIKILIDFYGVFFIKLDLFMNYLAKLYLTIIITVISNIYAQSQNTQVLIFITDNDCYKCIMPLNNIFKELEKFSQIIDSSRLKINTDSKIIKNRLREEFPLLPESIFNVDQSYVRDITSDSRSKIWIKSKDKILFDYSINKLSQSDINSIFKEIGIIHPANVYLLKNDRFESGKYNPLTFSNQCYFSLLERIRPSLLLGKIDNKRFITSYFKDVISENQYIKYLATISTKWNYNFYDFNSVKKVCSENHINISRVKSATCFSDQLFLVREIASIYNQENETILRNFDFLETYNLSIKNDTLCYEFERGKIISPFKKDLIEYGPFISEPFFQIDSSLYLYYRNYSDITKPMTNELIGGKLDFSSVELGYGNELITKDISESDQLKDKMKLFLYGNGTKLFFYNNKPFIAFLFLDKILDIDGDKVYSLVDWLKLFSVNFNSVDLEVNSICDVDVFNNTLRVVFHDSNSNYRYIKLEDKNISMFTLSKPLYYPNFRIFRDQSISFFIKDDQIEFYFFELP